MLQYVVSKPKDRIRPAHFRRGGHFREFRHMRLLAFRNIRLFAVDITVALWFSTDARLLSVTLKNFNGHTDFESLSHLPDVRLVVGVSECVI